MEGGFRPLAKGFIRMKIQDGCSVRFWTDLWHPKGRLIDLAGEIGTQKLGIGRSARICDVFVDGEWKFRRCRDHFLQDLVHDIRELPLILTANVPDRVLWRDGDNTYISKFNSKNTWSNIRKKKDQVMWSRLIWFQQGVPRFAFITWLAVRDMLSTGHRTAQWGQAQYFLYCGEPDETRDHLFLIVRTRSHFGSKLQETYLAWTRILIGILPSRGS